MTIINRRVTLLLVLPLFALPLLAGNDVSDLRYAPSDLTVSPPAIASSGNRFLTLWAAPPGERYPYVHIDGSLSDTAGSSNLPAFPVIPYANSDDVAVVGGGSGYVATWYERDVGSFFGRLTSDGILKFKSRTPIGGSRFSERVAFNGSEIAIVDSVGTVAFQQRTITLWIYDLNGNLLRSVPLMPSGGEMYAITTAGDDFVVVTAGDSGIIEWRAPPVTMGSRALRRPAWRSIRFR
jgi:hypothetical protein